MAEQQDREPHDKESQQGSGTRNSAADCRLQTADMPTDTYVTSGYFKSSEYVYYYSLCFPQRFRRRRRLFVTTYLLTIIIIGTKYINYKHYLNTFRNMENYNNI